MSLIRSLLVSRKIGLNNKVRHQTLFSFQKQQTHHFSWGNFKLNSSFQRLQNQPSSLHYSFMNPYFARKQYFFSLVSMMLLQSPFLSNYYTCYSQCESILLPSQDCSQSSSSIIIQKTQVQTNYVNQMKRAIRVLKRILQLFLTFLPVTALYPIHNYISSSQQLSGNDSYISSDWYLRLCLRCVEWSGAAMIKLMQVSLFLVQLCHARIELIILFDMPRNSPPFTYYFFLLSYEFVCGLILFDLLLFYKVGKLSTGSFWF